MLFSKFGNNILFFDPDLFLAVAKSACEHELGAEATSKLIPAFKLMLTTDFLIKQNLPKYNQVAEIMGSLLRKNDPRLNSRTQFEYSNTADIHAALEDIMKGLAHNVRSLWFTGTPITGRAPALKLEFRRYTPSSWIERLLGREDKIHETFVLESDSICRISGNSFNIAVHTPAAHLLVGTDKFQLVTKGTSAA